MQKEEAGERLDKFLALKFPEKSRPYLKKIIGLGSVIIDGKKAKSGQKVRHPSVIEITFPMLGTLDLKAVNIPLKIVFEDADLLVIDKPAGMTVHPGNNNAHNEDSLVNAILYHCKGKLSGINGVIRPGIVHRLDKDTSGLLIVAKNDLSHNYIADQFKNHEVQKMYYALAVGKIKSGKGVIEAPIGRDSKDRKKMAIINGKRGKASVTKFEVVEYPGDFSLLNVRLLTGRTHQIRVHFAGIGHPLVGDKVYGNLKINKHFQELSGLDRQFLHAYSLKFKLPSTKKEVEFHSDLPDDLMKVLSLIRK